MLLLDAAVHGQPVQDLTPGVYVYLGHRLLQGGGGERSYRQDAQQGNEGQEEGNHAFFQSKVPPNEIWTKNTPSVLRGGAEKYSVYSDTTQ